MENLTVLTIVFLVIYIVLTRIVLYHKLKVETQKLIQEQEPVFDSVPLGEAEFSKGEKYLLASCTVEQFKQLETTGRPVKLGYFTKEGWSGGLPFYLFKCPFCEAIKVDYKHGYGPALHCAECKTSTTFNHFILASKRHLV